MRSYDFCYFVIFFYFEGDFNPKPNDLCGCFSQDGDFHMAPGGMPEDRKSRKTSNAMDWLVTHIKTLLNELLFHP